MARYRVKETSFIDNKLVEAGAEIEFTGEPGSNLELVEGKRNYQGEEAHGTVYPPESADDLA